MDPSSPAGHAETIIVVGGGQAGSELAFELRRLRFAGRTVLISEEPHLPYQRPPLSKAVLTGEMPSAALALKSKSAYEKAEIEVRLSTRVESLDRVSKTIRLAGGDTLAYDRLALTTGGRARKIRIPGADLAGIFYLRTIDDVEALRTEIRPGRRLVIVGGGYVGLEVASATRRPGLNVVVLESATRVLARVAAPEISAFYEQVHAAEGVTIRTGATVAKSRAWAASCPEWWTE